MLAFGHNEHRLLTSAKVPRQGLRLLELEPGVLEEIQNGRQACSEQPSRLRMGCTPSSEAHCAQCFHQGRRKC